MRSKQKHFGPNGEKEIRGTLQDYSNGNKTNDSSAESLIRWRIIERRLCTNRIRRESRPDERGDDGQKNAKNEIEIFRRTVFAGSDANVYLF